MKCEKKHLTLRKKLRNFAGAGSFLVSSGLFEMPRSGIMTESVKK